MTKVMKSSEGAACSSWQPELMSSRVENTGMIEQALDVLADLEVAELSSQPQSAAKNEALNKAALESAYQEGFEAGLKQAQQEQEQHQHDQEQQQQQVHALLEQLHLTLQQRDQEIEQALFTLVSKITAKLTRHELSTDPKKLHQLIHEGMDCLPGQQGIITVSVAPDALEQIKPLLQEHIKADRMKCITDDNLTPGDFVIDTPQSHIDGNVNTRLDQLFEKLILS